MQTNEPQKIENKNKSPFNFVPKQQISKKQANANNKTKSYTFLDNEESLKEKTKETSPPMKKNSISKSLMLNPFKKHRSFEQSLIEDIDFITRKEYKDHSVCHICSKEFPSFMTHMKKKHCKICGNAVCADCSSERVKDNRACDLCVYKIRNKQQEDIREEYLIHYEESIKEMEIQLQNMENQIDELKNMTLTINTRTENESKNSKKIIKELDSNISEAKSFEQEKKHLYEKLLKEFFDLTDDLNKMKAEYERKEHEFHERKEEIEKRKKLLIEKNKEFKRIQNELKKIAF